MIRNGEPVEVPTADVMVGDLLLIRPGSKIPAEAVVEEGESDVDESMVTGDRSHALGPAGRGDRLAIGRGTLRKMRQNLGWAIGYNVIALPIAAGVFQPLLALSYARRSRRFRCQARA